MKAYIISFNRLTLLQNLAKELSKKCDVVIVDNCSTYPPLLEWLDSCEYEVIYMDQNYGHQVCWVQNLIGDDRYYIVTDHDLDISGLPDDWLDVLMKGLELFPNVIKSGLSLEINDLPDNAYANEAKRWESKFWHEQKNGYYLADIDTTLAVYDKTRSFGKLPNNRFFSAVRSDRPYTAKHIPWYLTSEKLAADPEEQHYQNSVTTYWSGKFKELI